jgi:hypothetical protein
MQMIYEKYPFKENGLLSKLFLLIPWGLKLPAGSDTLQNKILQGIRPRRTRSCRVSDPGTKSCGDSDHTEQWQRCVHFIADVFSRGSNTPQNRVLLGLIPCLTKSCWVSTFTYEYFSEFETEVKNILGCEFGVHKHILGLIRGENQRLKITCYCLFECMDGGFVVLALNVHTQFIPRLRLGTNR